jgi:hypothetical protein
MQLKNSDQKLEKEIKKAQEEVNRNRRWEVRSKPLLNLREELAKMATKVQKMYDCSNIFFKSQAKEQKPVQGTLVLDEFKTSCDDLLAYIMDGYLQKIVFTIDDKELQSKIQELMGVLLNNLNIIKPQLAQVAEQIGESGSQTTFNVENTKGIRNDVREIQSLINKKLEAL